MAYSGIHIKPSRKGLLHEKLGVPQGKKIPEAKIAAAKQSSSPSLRKEATFAENAKHFSHGGKKGGNDTRPKDHQHPRSHSEFEKLGS